jgi:serine/threonine protein kinase
MTSPADGAKALREKIHQVIREYHQRLMKGEKLTEERLFADHAHLMPELKVELEKYRATAAGPTVIDQPMSPISPLIADAEVHEMATQTAGSFKPGVVIPGYRLVRELSRGGQGVVFQAIQESTQRKVAIKVLRHGPLSSEEEEARFQREAQVLAALRHPHIVYVFDCGKTEDGSFYLVMEFVTGQPLDKWMNLYAERQASGHNNDDPAEALKLFMKISDAINAAHLRGVVHRDLKPSNIFVDTLGDPRILDFGLAHLEPDAVLENRTTRPVTITGQFLGSLPWASPEQAEGIPSKIDCRTDVYSLGVILYQMLTGQFPYEVVGNMRDVLDNIMRAEPSPPSVVIQASEAKRDHKQLRRRRRTAIVNPAIDAIVLKALAKRPEDRYVNAGELSRDIANYLSGKPTMAGGGVFPSPSPWPLRGMIATGFISVALGTAALMHYLFPPRVETQRTIVEVERPSADLPILGPAEVVSETTSSLSITETRPVPTPHDEPPAVIAEPKKLPSPPNGWKVELPSALVEKSGIPIAGLIWQGDGKAFFAISEAEDKTSLVRIATSFTSDPFPQQLPEVPRNARASRSGSLAWPATSGVTVFSGGGVQNIAVSYRKGAQGVAAAFNPAGTLLATASSDSRLGIWQVAGFHQRDSSDLREQADAVAALDWSASLNKIIVALKSEPKLLLLSDRAGEEGSIDTESTSPKDLLCSPKGSLAAVSYADRIAIVDLIAKKVAFSIPLKSPPLSVSWSGDERYLAVMSGGADGQNRLETFAMSKPDTALNTSLLAAPAGNGISPIAFVPGGSLLAVVSGKGRIDLISAEDQQIQGQIICLDTGSACIATNNKFVASHGLANEVRCVWSDETGAHSATVNDFAKQFEYQNDPKTVSGFFKH